MENWQEKPAGKHGFLQMKGDRFEFEDGTPVKFWDVSAHPAAVASATAATLGRVLRHRDTACLPAQDEPCR
jgi:hypothetical protein